MAFMNDDLQRSIQTAGQAIPIKLKSNQPFRSQHVNWLFADTILPVGWNAGDTPMQGSTLDVDVNSALGGSSTSSARGQQSRFALTTVTGPPPLPVHVPYVNNDLFDVYDNSDSD
jgi:hypothetical protein